MLRKQNSMHQTSFTLYQTPHYILCYYCDNKACNGTFGIISATTRREVLPKYYHTDGIRKRCFVP